MEASDTAPSVTETDVLLKALRQELKQWETSFFATNKRKAERQDIKEHPEIEQRYKKYNDLRHPPPKPPRTETATPPKKRHHPSSSYSPHTTLTPNKHLKTTHGLHPSVIDPYDLPVSTHRSPLTHRTAIGPTPQKDGMVLGLFDGLSAGSHSKTPSKRQSLLAVAGNVQATPSKRPSTQSGDEEAISTGKRHRKSPVSDLKRADKYIYLTPLARRIVNSKSTPTSCSGVSKLCFDETPNFLRRHSQRTLTGKENTYVEGEISWSPVVSRILPKAHGGKRLSALVKGLRNMEEETLDEELEVLKEMEDCDHSASAEQLERVLVKDSQRPDMPLGPDGGLESEDDEEYADEGKGRDGKSLKVWKKKGQKRTTRKVVMKPNTAKWKPEPVWKGEDESEEEACVASIGDSQVIVLQSKQDTEDREHYTERGMDNRAITDDKSEKKRTDKEGLATKVKKKISATAHANFRALKTKNKQTKGKGRGIFKRKR